VLKYRSALTCDWPRGGLRRAMRRGSRGSVRSGGRACAIACGAPAPRQEAPPGVCATATTRTRACEADQRLRLLLTKSSRVSLCAGDRAINACALDLIDTAGTQVGSQTWRRRAGGEHESGGHRVSRARAVNPRCAESGSLGIGRRAAKSQPSSIRCATADSMLGPVSAGVPAVAGTSFDPAPATNPRRSGGVVLDRQRCCTYVCDGIRRV
jgi:hypothetical protein